MRLTEIQFYEAFFIFHFGNSISKLNCPQSYTQQKSNPESVECSGPQTGLQHIHDVGESK